MFCFIFLTPIFPHAPRRLACGEREFLRILGGQRRHCPYTKSLKSCEFLLVYSKKRHMLKHDGYETRVLKHTWGRFYVHGSVCILAKCRSLFGFFRTEQALSLHKSFMIFSLTIARSRLDGEVRVYPSTNLYLGMTQHA